MKFRTEVEIQNSAKKIQPSSKIFGIGSCFAAELTQMLSAGQLQTLCNPFGTLFNPVSIENAVRRLHGCIYYNREELISHDDSYISLDHSTAFDADFEHKTLEKINVNIDVANRFLQSADLVIVTLGSAFAYEFLPKNKIVANCHKIPAKFFEKKLLSQTEISESVQSIAELLKDICPADCQIIFTVSPVRHTKDGMQENSLSKAKLITAVHEELTKFPDCRYLPVYEIINDDLRDYRFYKDDLIHPNSQAMSYIFEKFGNAYFSDETMDFVEENLRIVNAQKHRPANENSEKYRSFLEDIDRRIAAQRQKVKHKIFNFDKYI